MFYAYSYRVDNSNMYMANVLLRIKLLCLTTLDKCLVLRKKIVEQNIFQK